MESFKASTQYGDWKGTASADDAHPSSLHDYLQDKGLINTNEFLAAASLWVSEGSTNVRAFVFQGGDDLQSVQNALAAIVGPIPVREINVKLTAEEFLDLFKISHVMLTWNGLELEGREYSVKG